MFLDYELIITSKILIKKLGFLSFDTNININLNDYYLYYLNPNFYENINKKKIFIFLGYNLRLESPILNIKLRKKKIKEDIFFLFIGNNFNDNLNCKSLGLNILNLVNYLQGKLKINNLIIKKIKKLNIDYNNILDLNLFLLGNNIILRKDNKDIINIIKKKFNYINLISLINVHENSMYITASFLKNSYTYFKKYVNIKTNLNILNLNLSNILYEELNMFNNIHNTTYISNNDIIYMFGINDFLRKKSKFCIFQGHHLNLEYLNIDLIFPNVTFLEKSSNYLDIEGNILQTNFILYPPVFSRND
jgi:NADH-quinone oxidoreductase subunit G